MTIESLPVYGGKRGTKEFRTPVNVAEMIAHIQSKRHVWFRSNDGSAREAKVNSAVKLWKKDLNRMQVSLKYGLYECGQLTQDDINRILIPVEAVTPGNAPSLATHNHSGLAPSLE